MYLTGTLFSLSNPIYYKVLSCTTSWLINLSMTTFAFFVAQPRGVSFSRKRLQNYCFYLDWPNFQSFFQHFLRKRLIFNVCQHYRFRGVLSHALVLTAKTAAKLLLSHELTKYLRTFFALSLQDIDYQHVFYLRCTNLRCTIYLGILRYVRFSWYG